MEVNGIPEKVTMDKSGASKAASDETNVYIGFVIATDLSKTASSGNSKFVCNYLSGIFDDAIS